MRKCTRHLCPQHIPQWGKLSYLLNHIPFDPILVEHDKLFDFHIDLVILWQDFMQSASIYATILPVGFDKHEIIQRFPPTREDIRMLILRFQVFTSNSRFLYVYYKPFFQKYGISLPMISGLNQKNTLPFHEKKTSNRH